MSIISKINNRFPVPWVVKESYFSYSENLENFFPILFSLNAIFFFFYANEREEFVDYLTY